MYCSKCGQKIEGNFCSNCGNQSGSSSQAPMNSNTNAYAKESTANSHNTYRLIVGIVMIILGFCIFIASTQEDIVAEYENIGYDVTLGFMIPGILSLVGGVLSISSRKINNILLLVSGICYIAAAISNMCGIKDISLLFIMCCVFGPLNIVFYKKSSN